jgi:hypothetical protein
MKNTLLAIVFVAGIVVGTMMTAFRGLESSAVAQPPAKLETGRYMISSWAYGMHVGSGHGAYVLDTQTGEAFIINDREGAQSLGKVTK